MPRGNRITAIVILSWMCLVASATAQPLPLPEGLPVDGARLIKSFPLRPVGSGFPNTIRNRLSIQQVRDAIRQHLQLIVVDFSHITKTLDHQPVDPARIYGKIVCGPYPFEALETGFRYPRYRSATLINQGRGVIDVGYLLGYRTNSEDWTDGGMVGVRVQLLMQQPGIDLDLGVYDTTISFRKSPDGSFLLLPSIVEGPMVNLVTSDDPTQCVIALRTSEPLRARIKLNDGRSFETAAESLSHEIAITGLEPNRLYQYQVEVGGRWTPPFQLRSAPPKGAGGFRFAYGGDSREGVGLGLESHMGCNYLDLNRLAAIAYRLDARFLLQGGDLVNGYTTKVDDYRTQLYGWKHAVMGFHHERPVYPAMGNHECLVYNFDDGSSAGLSLDRWPYESGSSESIFAEQLVLPKNGPQPSDPNRPTYQENVYSFQYGCVKCIAVNNNYWISYGASLVGGAPEGYLLPDQLDWIEKQVADADGDASIRYVIVYMQEPVLPNGGHIHDGMWYNGDNRRRAFRWDGKALRPAGPGMIETRNRLLRAVHGSRKVVAVLSSDEHGYSKLLVDAKVPIGVVAKDDKNRDGMINFHEKDVDGDGVPEPKEQASPLSELKHPVWHLVGGGFGAPYYSRQPTPWNEFWTDQGKGGGRFFRYSSQPNILMFEVSENDIGVTVLNHFGERIDRIPSLTKFETEE